MVSTMNYNLRGRITGLGSAVPERVVTNFDLEKMVDTTDEWIQSRTGIKERRICDTCESMSDLAVAAGRKARWKWRVWDRRTSS